MIRAEEILGEVRPPKWRGGKGRVHLLDGRPQPQTPLVLDEALRIAIGQAMRAGRKQRRIPMATVASRIDRPEASCWQYELGTMSVPEFVWPEVLKVLGVDIAAMVAEWRGDQR